jgi:hypothetical protein
LKAPATLSSAEADKLRPQEELANASEELFFKVQFCTMNIFDLSILKGYDSENVGVVHRRPIVQITQEDS